jgi:hypothetical protein
MPRRPLLLLLGGALLVLAQLGIVHLASGNSDLKTTYRALCQWDCRWYASIVHNGYRSDLPPKPQDPEGSNVAFFPGYPVAGMLVKATTGYPATLALPMAAQGAALIFWTLLLAIVTRRGKDETQRSQIVRASTITFLIFAQPASLFLVLGYAESVYLVGVVLLVGGWQLAHRSGWLAAAAGGFIACATKLAALPLALVPLLEGAFTKIGRPSGRAVVIAAASIAAPLSFFAFCQWRFGVWNLYMITEHIGWDVAPNYVAMLDPGTWTIAGGPDRFMLPVVLAALIVFATLEWRRRVEGAPFRLALLVAVFLMLFIIVSGVQSLGFRSAARYTLPMIVTLLLAANHRLVRGESSAKVSPLVPAAWAAGLLMFAMQTLPIAARYVRGEWAD